MVALRDQKITAVQEIDKQQQGAIQRSLTAKGSLAICALCAGNAPDLPIIWNLRHERKP